MKKKKKKKKMNNSENGYFPFNTCPMLAMSPANVVFDGMVTMMSQKVKMNAH